MDEAVSQNPTNPADLTIGQTAGAFDAAATPSVEPLPFFSPVYAPRKPAVFLDRDGTLIEEVNYCRRVEDVHVYEDVSRSLIRLRQAGYVLVIITNQAGIGRGIITEEEYRLVQTECLRQIGPHLISGTYYCPDHPDRATERRKPGIGMLQEAQRDLNIELNNSWFIGDKALDIECGKNAALRTILVATGYGQSEACEPDYRAKDLASAVDCILVD